MANEKQAFRRRTFLEVVGVAGAVSAVGAPGCGGETPAASGPTDVGPASDWSARTWKLLCAQNLIVGRDDAGYYALSAVCTHQGCTVTMAGSACVATAPGVVSANGAIPVLSCPCHASVFNVQNGARISGEAQRNLPAYQVTITAGRVLVDRSVTVDGAARTAPA
ncbi:MAG: Rieske (2Fe-2S) protein [Polyangiales bacterium]